MEGFEPPTVGFGIRCSTNWSYTPSVLYLLFLALLVTGMTATEFTILLDLELSGSLQLFLSVVIAALAISTF